MNGVFGLEFDFFPLGDGMDGYGVFFLHSLPRAGRIACFFTLYGRAGWDCWILCYIRDEHTHVVAC